MPAGLLTGTSMQRGGLPGNDSSGTGAALLGTYSCGGSSVWPPEVATDSLLIPHGNRRRHLKRLPDPPAALCRRFPLTTPGLVSQAHTTAYEKRRYYCYNITFWQVHLADDLWCPKTSKATDKTCNEN